VVSAVQRTAAQSAANRVKAVGLRVGSLSGAVPEALRGAWPIASSGTLMEGAELELESVQAAVECPACGEVEIDEFYALVCPKCGTPTGKLARGREFEVSWADLDQG
jgi:hydrogenase nickel incorporation protein HypA/HybF